ncbi:hypothetical protein ACHHV8_11010 [Paenibacillus sp. TAB 01]|uniref:hypothetical protein n=1 Tax=Paenibacillus sp. TAB 01 TaxID=3368988 RepID=UPI0037524EB3
MQVLALLRGKSEEQIQQQKVEINKFCEMKGFTPIFIEFSDIQQVDFSSFNEKTIVFFDLSRITRDMFVYYKFLDLIVQENLIVYLAQTREQLTPPSSELDDHMKSMIAILNKYDREKMSKIAKSWWTSERRSEHSQRMKEIYRKKKAAQTP